jgi:hypothetical protein
MSAPTTTSPKRWILDPRGAYLLRPYGAIESGLRKGNQSNDVFLGCEKELSRKTDAAGDDSAQHLLHAY